MKIIHISDLHFGTHQGNIVEDASHSINQHNPDLIIISGDFTQIASSEEFIQAQNFLATLKTPYFCVPGNHDVPQRNLWQRFFSPYNKYKQYIHPDLCPRFENDMIILAGLNSARRALPHWNWANGAISTKQLDYLESVYKNASDKNSIGIKKWRICTFHHPVQKMQDMPLNVTVFGRKRTMAKIQTLGIDLVLTGHVHHASISAHGNDQHECIYLSASTAMSSRLRQQQNGYNVITLDYKTMTIEIFQNSTDGFGLSQTYKKIKN